MTTATVTPRTVNQPDDLWVIEPAGDGTRAVDMLYRPTGDVLTARSLTEGQRMIQRGDAVAALRAKAHLVLEVCEQTGAVAFRITPRITEAQFEAAKAQAKARRAAQLASARRTLAILDGVLTPAGITPDSVCECGSLLAFVTGAWLHVDGCHGCWAAPTGWAQGQCADRDSHTWCDRPAPAVCEHPRCIAAHRVDVPVCTSLGAVAHFSPADAPACCGCCQA